MFPQREKSRGRNGVQNCIHCDVSQYQMLCPQTALNRYGDYAGYQSLTPCPLHLRSRGAVLCQCTDNIGSSCRQQSLGLLCLLVQRRSNRWLSQCRCTVLGRHRRIKHCTCKRRIFRIQQLCSSTNRYSHQTRGLPIR